MGKGKEAYTLEQIPINEGTNIYIESNDATAIKTYCE